MRERIVRFVVGAFELAVTVFVLTLVIGEALKLMSEFVVLP